MPPKAACSHSYARWRYLTFQQLFEDSPCTPAVQLPFLYAKTIHDQPQKRGFHAATRKHRKNGPDDTDIFSTFDRKTLAERAYIQSTYGVVRDAKGSENNDDNDDVKPEKPSTNKPSIWKPTSQPGVKDLSALAESFAALADKARADALPPIDRRDIQIEADDHGHSISPLEVLDKTEKVKVMRRPTKEELATLRHNPWAKMLAAPLRMCMASHARLPNTLMLSFAQIVNPNNGQVYLLPDDLADLQAFKKRLQTKNMHNAIVIRGGSGKKLQVLPYRLLLEKLTDTFLALDSKTKESRTRNGVVAKSLFPTKWIQNTQKVKAYQNASRDYFVAAEKQGLTDGIHKRPLPILDIDNIQWQAAIVERIPNIMCQRVLLCLDRMAGVDEKRRKNRAYKHLVRFEWPQGGSPDFSRLDDELAPGNDFWNDMGDIEAEGAISGSSQGQGVRQDGRPPIAVRPSEIDLNEPPKFIEDKPTHHWIPGSFFLHIGPSKSITQHITGENTCEGGAAYLEQLNPADLGQYIPPMINIEGTYRLPIFNIPAMLGTRFAGVLSRLLEKYSIYRPTALANQATSPTASNATTIAANTNFLILVKSTAPCSQFLTGELWQLWRYLGGTDCLTQEEGEAKIRNTKVDMSHTLSPGAWKQLYHMLDLPFTNPPTTPNTKLDASAGGDERAIPVESTT